MMTIKEARKILGNKYDHLSDDQIQKMIDWLHTLCNRVIDDVLSGRIEKYDKSVVDTRTKARNKKSI